MMNQVIMKLEEMTMVTIFYHDDELHCNETGRNNLIDCIHDHDDELVVMKRPQVTILDELRLL